ncbi:GNAT family N-acetyltransferase [Rhodocyclus tenuis]|uniref:GNAT superfamily N-acetyltransferase n=1 Tax=Rhodocyclus tenuis TaxID=1066 RepID=A0A840GEF6_RHOTE|nr:GNAT family N-acetyltransferase [Rhodocyclus tenuis]MBB4246942.1 GNAT superfamily N-acetyltransferase [Rhodocyclus tenuis]
MSEAPLPISLRVMTAVDIDGVVAVQRLCYPPAMNEPAAIIRSRLATAPAFAWVAASDAGICAYLVGYPSLLGKVTALGGGFVVPAAPDCLYLHDLAVAPRALGRGVAGALLRLARDAASAAGFSRAALVSVQDSLAFWQKQGFSAGPALTPQQRVNLASYPPPAFYLSCRID